jgi:hypothetical protein
MHSALWCVLLRASKCAHAPIEYIHNTARNNLLWHSIISAYFWCCWSLTMLLGLQCHRFLCCFTWPFRCHYCDLISCAIVSLSNRSINWCLVYFSTVRRNSSMVNAPIFQLVYWLSVPDDWAPCLINETYTFHQYPRFCHCVLDQPLRHLQAE